MAKQSFAVLGLGIFGKMVAEELTRGGAEVLAVDVSEELVQEVADIVTCAVRADVTEAEALKNLGLESMDGVVVAIADSLDASILATMAAKEAGVPFILAKCQNEIHGKILEKIGADRVIVPEKASAVRIARNMLSGNFLDFIELSDRIRMVEIRVKPEWIGKNLVELSFRKRYHVNVIAYRKNGEVFPNLDPAERLTFDMTLFVLGDTKEMAKLH